MLPIWVPVSVLLRACSASPKLVVAGMVYQLLSGMRDRHEIVAGRSQKCCSFCFHHPKGYVSCQIQHKSKIKVAQTCDCPIGVRNVRDPDFAVFDCLRRLQMNEAWDTIVVVFEQMRSVGDTPSDVENQEGHKRYDVPKNKGVAESENE